VHEIRAARRYDGIDVLRGISILAVLVHHIHIRLMFNHVSFEKMLPAWIGRILFWNGANGVTVFFAISGFLITSMSVRRWKGLPGIRPTEFYWLRFARIAPLLIALLAVLSVLHLEHVTGFVITKTSLSRALVAALTFHVNWLEAAHGYLPGNWDVLWSLSNEEVFYLFFPLACLVLRRRWMLLSFLAAFVITGPFARTLTHNGLWADYGYLSCMDGIALGCLAALATPWLRERPGVLTTTRIAGVSLMVLVLCLRPLVRTLHLYETGLDFTALALGTVLLLIPIAVANRTGSKISSPLRWLGRNSYEIYLTHMFVVMFGVQIFVAQKWPVMLAPVYSVVLLLLAIAVGAAVARWYTEPLNRRLRANSTAGRKAAAPLADSAAGS
jgi:peptidoglycan/LPS O-acetylase OafA/YrhL